MKFKLKEAEVSVSELQQAVHEDPYFIFVMGSTGSGKNFISYKYFPLIHMVDIDKYVAKFMATDTTGKDERKFISKAVHFAKSQLIKNFDKKRSVIQVGTGGNLQAMINKIDLAKSKGMRTAIILVDTNIEIAKQRNIKRAESGDQRLVPDWKIDVSYKASQENYHQLKNKVDFATIIKN